MEWDLSDEDGLGPKRPKTTKKYFLDGSDKMMTVGMRMMRMMKAILRGSVTGDDEGERVEDSGKRTRRKSAQGEPTSSLATATEAGKEENERRRGERDKEEWEEEKRVDR